MVLVASLLLPLVAVLLFAMDRVEDWVGSASPPGEKRAKDAKRRTRHLRLVRDAEADGEAAEPTAADGASAPDPWTVRKQDRGIVRERDRPTVREQDRETVREQDPETVRKRDPETVRKRDPETVRKRRAA
ncbi:hypothetical protein [Streptomyces evansiae]|uniref:hypothetical protein n=1 Tax=Streptomyces evansiae TaxID=3075535 RepID=UPI002887F202|nr:hypothetical protein [Streptomyces sp. DSM 41859]MDT0425000.1 hypothetical protein [Streptomyces sp. DSM 41859]